MGTLDDRQEKRFAFHNDIIVEDTVLAQSVDISYGGVLVKTDMPMPIGSIVSLSIPAFDLSLQAEVKYYAKGLGTGLKFIVKDNAQWNTLAGIIDTISRNTEGYVEKPAVLIVDDNMTFREALARRLHEEGYSVAQAPDGMEAIRQMNMYPFHAIVVDLNMKRIDGYKLIGLIRGAPDHKDKRIIVVSSTEDPMVEKRVMRIGANGFVHKGDGLPANVIKVLQSSIKT